MNYIENHIWCQIVLCILFTAIVGFPFRNDPEPMSSPPEQTSTDTGGDWAAIFPWIFWIGLMVFIGWLNN